MGCCCVVSFPSYSILISDEIYKGSENSIILFKEYVQEFTCYFDLIWYPFDRQRCYMNFTIQVILATKWYL